MTPPNDSTAASGSAPTTSLFGDDGEPLPYGDALLELEEILASLEGAAADIDTLATKVKRAADLVSYCRARLDVVRTDVAAVVDDLTGES